ncbi:Putative AAA+ ATPase domain, CDR ABC transporter, ABC-2 type transporter [Septoria linicola]|uniref:AAA+ ATPase domain, CDR ABC transporter, ABC-2 type transporter n=1 Tax=Septoria linicola TaxID=215465 RepID=A0A9Q9ARK8_9PEZI|nr:Putative AAA+ ATPase domain, CDR ABC transporter, ABC-2 type transporter [Septoria linicola]
MDGIDGLDWSSMPEVSALNAGSDDPSSGARKLGITWQDLTIQGVGADASFNENVGSQFIPPQLHRGTAKPTLRTIVDKSHGCVKPGEMLLVLGRPGAGCTSLLKVLSNRREEFSAVEGEVRYGSLDHREAARYRGQIVMNTEEEIFYSSLTVGQTIDFATRLKVPKHKFPNYATGEEARVASRDFLLNALGISHTFDTRVGDAYMRGVSGGERKRVSIIETMATRGSVFCWDNSTRGLDASTALQYIKAVRTMTDIFGLASVVTLYQAGNAIYDQFDKGLVLEKGQQLYYGPASAAKGFMEDLGFACADGANVADFLTGVTVPTERRIRPGYEAKFPRNGSAIKAHYDTSNLKALMAAEYTYPATEAAKDNTQEFERTMSYEKHPGLLTRSSPATVGFATQLDAAIKRQVNIIWGDKTNLITKQASNLIQAFSAGSLFYDAPDNSAGLFSKSGVIFVTLLFNALLAQSEVTDSFTGRPVMQKHKHFAFHHPAAWVLAQTITDTPILLFQVSAFTLVTYFLAGLTMDAGTFFIFWFVIFTTTVCITALFRALGAGFKTFDDASKISGVVVMAVLMYAGYMIPKTDMVNWFIWIYWIDPIAYAFNALLSNEFHDKIIDCVGPNLVPSGPGYDSIANQACTGVRGAPPGAASLTGTQYLDSLKYSHSTMWRNIGIVWVWWAFYLGLTILFTTLQKGSDTRSGVPLIPREHAKRALIKTDDEEAQLNEKISAPSDNSSDISGSKQDLVQNTSIFTWKDVKYTVRTPQGPRVLLNNVHGWVKPGQLGALMGSSGAGKTTLLDVLAQRKTDGTLSGSVLVDGRPLTVSFQRSAGYVEQLDVHEALTTVREALEFSALLRQPWTTPKEDKLKYVDVILDLLEMRDIEHCLVGAPGQPGLTIEQRKRLTIGVELVAKPSVLIFLDEPTSGLDGQAAFNTVRFLKKLAAAGQAILVTIHQPSAQLFAEFDTLLLLAKGGNTVYFGDIGDDASEIRDYFARNGAPCPPGMNPAEHMIEVVSDTKKDWSKIWLESPEHEDMLEKLDGLVHTTSRQRSITLQNDLESEFAMPLWEQVKIVTTRANKALWRNTQYVNNKFALHIITGLFTGFSFWKLEDSVGELQLRMFALFNFIFVAPGVIAQLQPLFIEKRDIYDTREKKSKMYSWIAFVTGLIVSELPYLVICAIQFFFCFYYTVGLPTDSHKAGAVFFVMLMYEFIYTGIGQFIAAYAPNAVAASLVNPLVIFTLVGYSGVLVPYSQIVDFWKYWLYYINPFKYLMGSLLVFTSFSIDVECKDSELAIFDPVGNQTCFEYLEPYLQGAGSGANLLNPSSTAGCQVCQYNRGSDWLDTLNLKDYYYGWRDAAIVVLFVFSSYGLVFLLMKLRTKKTKKVE